jgi:hypothetical protein
MKQMCYNGAKCLRRYGRNQFSIQAIQTMHMALNGLGAKRASTMLDLTTRFLVHSSDHQKSTDTFILCLEG